VAPQHVCLVGPGQKSAADPATSVKALKLGCTATGVGVFCGKELAKLAESYEVVRYNFFVLNPNTQIIFQKCYQADQGQRVKL